MMDIGLVGKGSVGNAVFLGLSQLGHSMSFFDTKYPDSQINDVLYTELIFVCVPTNSTKSGDCDVSLVALVVDQLSKLNYSGVVAIKSTVIPGTTEKLIEQYPNLKICCVPEFLRQRSALSDFCDHHDVLVVGSDSQQIADVVVHAHGSLPKKIKIVSPSEAEIVKYFNNVHNAMEIVFANAVHSVCNKIGANYQNVYDSMQHRNNINTSYLRCSDHYKGFGGHCLPKDTKAWANYVDSIGIDVDLFKVIVKDNRKFV